MLARLTRQFSPRLPLTLLAAAVLPLLAACAPEQVDMNIHDIFSSDAARYALQTQMSPALLASVGGFLPATSWPDDAAPLIVDVQIVAENKIDLSTSNLDLGSYSGMRLHWAQLVAAAADGSPLAPLPSKVEIYVGPVASTSITDTGVVPLASGAFPSIVGVADCDAGLCATDGGVIFNGVASDAGSGESDAGSGQFDAGSGDSDAGSADAGSGGSDAGEEFDAGSGSGGAGSNSDGGVAGQTLVFSSDAQLALQKLVFAAQPFALFVVLHMPIDSQLNPALPSGGVDLSFDVQFELAR